MTCSGLVIKDIELAFWSCRCLPLCLRINELPSTTTIIGRRRGVLGGMPTRWWCTWNIIHRNAKVHAWLMQHVLGINVTPFTHSFIPPPCVLWLVSIISSFRLWWMVAVNCRRCGCRRLSTVERISQKNVGIFNYLICVGRLIKGQSNPFCGILHCASLEIICATLKDKDKDRN